MCTDLKQILLSLFGSSCFQHMLGTQLEAWGHPTSSNTHFIVMHICSRFSADGVIVHLADLFGIHVKVKTLDYRRSEA